jgi:hypothetical protein
MTHPLKYVRAQQRRRARDAPPEQPVVEPEPIENNQTNGAKGVEQDNDS